MKRKYDGDNRKTAADKRLKEAMPYLKILDKSMSREKIAANMDLTLGSVENWYRRRNAPSAASIELLKEMAAKAQGLEVRAIPTQIPDNIASAVVNLLKDYYPYIKTTRDLEKVLARRKVAYV